MAVQTILQSDIPELRQTSAQVISFDAKLSILLDDLADTMEAHRGLGLSAPQIGIHQRIIVIDVGQGIQEYINPEIIETSGKVEGYESCLSFPGYTFKIIRPKQVTVMAQDRLGQPVQIEASDLLARVICHEVDHLNGVLFMDHLSEEDMFSQLFVNALISDDEDEQDGILPIPLSEMEVKACQQELQLSIDLLTELTWKLALSLEILKDYKNLFDEPVAWNRLEEIIDVLDKTIEIVEGKIEALDEECR